MRIVLFLCLFLIQYIRLFADPGKEDSLFSIEELNDQNGLPQNSVKFIAPDVNGFIWLATEGGLVRFDGRQCRTFNSSNLAVSGDRVSSILPGITGSSLVISIGRKKDALLVNEGKATVAPTSYKGYEYLYNRDASETYAIYSSPDGYLERGMTKEHIVALKEDACFRITKDTIRFEKLGVEQYRMIYSGLKPEKLFVLDGHLCYLSEKGLFEVFDRDKIYTARLMGALTDIPLSGSFGKAMKLYWNFAAQQVFIYFNNVCYRLKLTDEGHLHSRPVLNNFDLQEKDIVTIYQDEKNERVFLGSITKGLFISTRKKFRVLIPGGKRTSVFYAQAPFGNKGIVSGGTLFDSLFKTKKLPVFNEFNDAYSILRDHKNTYWYKNGRMLYHLNSDLTKILWVHELEDAINQLYLDEDGRLWIGGERKGLYVLETTAATPKPRLFTDAIRDASYLLRENSTTLWVGTGNGLYRMHASGRVDTIPDFNGKYIRSLLIPKTGEVWITVDGQGVFIYKNNRVITIPLDPQQYLLSAHCIVPDGQGYLWITTNKGLLQTSYRDLTAYAEGEKREIYYLYYRKEKGFNTNEFNGGCEPCALKLQNGDISLPSMDGLVYFTPAQINAELPDKKIFVDNIKVDAKEITVADAVKLPNNFHHFSMQISSPYFGDTRNLQCYYLLKSANDDHGVWLPVSNEQVIEFSSLPYGEYQLFIRKISGFGKQNITERVFSIEVMRAYYETIWFRVLVAGLIVLLIFIYFWFRTHRLRKKNLAWEARVSERTSELHEALGLMRKQAFMQQRLIAAISHDIKTPLKYLMLVTADEQQEEEEQTAVYTGLYRMFHLVDNLIQYMKSQFRNDDSRLEMVDIGLLLEEKADIFRPVAHSKGVSIVNLTSGNITALVNGQLLAVVIHNLLDNAVKYTSKGFVRMEVSRLGDSILIRLADSGIGMPLPLVEWINGQADDQVHPDERPPANNGLGLLIVMELLQLINAALQVTASEASGTTILLTISPVK
ncbi:two-component regulator propeller domain-containing protein [Chitinophaga sp. MM2321]|uniref:ligand-binding sensor domain-containing protein n=1 Tax=Chitinophaga sp. MM2321 TaxID=3137178 RepID=UPI0032D59A8D